jgi:hypothetical protein
MIALETLCIKQIYKRHAELQSDKTFKLVNSMLDILDREGLYGAVIYLQVYDKSGVGNAILGAFNGVLNAQGLNNPPLAEEVTDDNREQVKRWYGKEVSGDDPRSALAEMALRRLLIHLRFESKVKATE